MALNKLVVLTLLMAFVAVAMAIPVDVNEDLETAEARYYGGYGGGYHGGVGGGYGGYRGGYGGYRGSYGGYGGYGGHRGFGRY